jgi:hypothetical protein
MMAFKISLDDDVFSWSLAIYGARLVWLGEPV